MKTFEEPAPPGLRHLVAVAIIMALLAAGSAFAADMLYRDGKDSLRLTDAPCPASILELVPKSIRDNFHFARATLNGKVWEGCWAVYQGDKIFVQYADGDYGMVSMAVFKREASV